MDFNRAEPTCSLTPVQANNLDLFHTKCYALCITYTGGFDPGFVADFPDWTELCTSPNHKFFTLTLKKSLTVFKIGAYYFCLLVPATNFKVAYPVSAFV